MALSLLLGPVQLQRAVLLALSEGAGAHRAAAQRVRSPGLQIGEHPTLRRNSAGARPPLEVSTGIPIPLHGWGCRDLFVQSWVMPVQAAHYLVETLLSEEAVTAAIGSVYEGGPTSLRASRIPKKAPFRPPAAVQRTTGTANFSP